VDESQETPQTSNAPAIDGTHTGAPQDAYDGIARGAVYLAAAWEEHSRHEFEAYSVEDTQVDWQGARYVLGESGYYLPDSTRAGWARGKYNQGKEGLATAYERVLDLPPVVPLLVLWVAGVALVGTCALVLYWVGRLLVGLAAGSI
jgi:hypothetical protein